jgi:hypothetical protein
LTTIVLELKLPTEQLLSSPVSISSTESPGPADHPNLDRGASSGCWPSCRCWLHAVIVLDSSSDFRGAGGDHDLLVLASDVSMGETREAVMAFGGFIGEIACTYRCGMKSK